MVVCIRDIIESLPKSKRYSIDTSIYDKKKGVGLQISTKLFFCRDHKSNVHLHWCVNHLSNISMYLEVTKKFKKDNFNTILFYLCLDPYRTIMRLETWY